MNVKNTLILIFVANISLQCKTYSIHTNDRQKVVLHDSQKTCCFPPPTPQPHSFTNVVSAVKKMNTERRDINGSPSAWRALQSAPLLCQINQASALYDNQHIQYPEPKAERRRRITLRFKRGQREKTNKDERQQRVKERRGQKVYENENVKKVPRRFNKSDLCCGTKSASLSFLRLCPTEQNTSSP